MNTDRVHHPSHYHKDSGVEVIDAIKAWSDDNGLSFMLGNVIKYCARAGHKDNALQDLEKASWYIQQAILAIKQSEETPEIIEVDIDGF